ncbi:hypothetical protein G6F37_004261 [Rhizopus arrhizus]|nr:hypothetical protein G6F38_004373 [Rhizopus arrhizus]KAG1160145.1 hypothetical protein G6F37_004261 [Rhizopus arrhizus]
MDSIDKLEAGYTSLKKTALNGSIDKHRGSDTSEIPQIQIVDEHQKFSKHLSEYMEKWGLSDAGFKYNVVAVFGSQSTGKSTLLNKLFGTKFAEMNEDQRQQTTRGIWLSRGRGMHVLVMDVEGTDSREHGEDQDFERKSALFSMATSEVIILNLWEHQVGLYQGANMGLLKTVFEVNLQLFQDQKGDFIGTTPLSNLSEILTADLEKIWEGLSKPKGLEYCKITDYFDFMFIGLPHKILMPEKFEEEVVKLRERFNDPNNPNFVFRPEYHKRIPADGYQLYVSSIWDKILANKDLDLPTQQELLAQYRCDEIANDVFTNLHEAIAPFKSSILEKGEILEDLGEKMKGLHQETLQSFDRHASRYSQNIYHKKRAEMMTELNACLNVYFVGQLKNLHKKAVWIFERDLQEQLKNTEYGFAEIVTASLEEASSFFEDGAKAMMLEGTDWSYVQEEGLLKEELDDIASEIRVKEFIKMNKLLEKRVEAELADLVTLELNRPASNMWHKVIDGYKSTLANAEKTLEKQAQSKKNRETKKSYKVLNIFHFRFEEKFRYDNNGLPKVWKPLDNIDAYFKKARDETLSLIKLFSKIDLNSAEIYIEPTDDFDFEQSLVVLGKGKQVDISNRFRQESDAFYLEAKRSVITTTTELPTWAIVAIIFLGWNEFMAILKNPYYLALCIVCIVICYIIRALDMWTPLERILSTLLRETSSMARKKIFDEYIIQVIRNYEQTFTEIPPQKVFTQGSSYS